MAWAVDWTTLLGDPSKWTADYKTKLVMVAVTVALMLHYKLKPMYALASGIFFLGVTMTWQMAIAGVLMAYAYGKRNYIVLGVCGWAIWCLYQGYKLPFVS